MSTGPAAEMRGVDDAPYRRNSRHYLAEAVGTAILVLVGPGAAMVAASTHAFGHIGVALAFGLVVTLLVAAFGTASGAGLNPAREEVATSSGLRAACVRRESRVGPRRRPTPTPHAGTSLA